MRHNTVPEGLRDEGVGVCHTMTNGEQRRRHTTRGSERPPRLDAHLGSSDPYSAKNFDAIVGTVVVRLITSPDVRDRTNNA